MAIKTPVAFFDIKPYEKPFYAEQSAWEPVYFENRLDSQTASLAQGFSAIACFVNDQLDRECLSRLREGGVELIALRSAGFNNVDGEAAQVLGIKVCRVPAYSPRSVAEFTLLQMLSLSRKIHRAYQRTRDLNFSLDGLQGSTLSGKTIGVVGVGKIGRALIQTLQGFQCSILAHDIHEDQDLQKQGVKFTDRDSLFRQADFVCLLVPLNAETHNLVDAHRLKQMKSTAFIINTGRGGLIDSKALIQALKKRQIAGAALDVYEEEERYFFGDYSQEGIDDDVLARLVSFPNVLVTSHQGYLTDESLQQIAQVTTETLNQWQNQEPLSHEIQWSTQSR